MRKKTNILFFTVLYIPLLLGLGIYVGKSIFWGNDTSYLGTKSTLNASSNVKNIKADGTMSLSSADINSLINAYLPEGLEKGPLKVESVLCNIKEGKIEVFAPVKYHKMKLLLSTQGIIEYEGENKTLYYYPKHIRVGKLPLPKGLMYSLINKYVPFNKENERIEVKLDGLPLDIESLEVKKDKLLLKIRSLDLGAMKPVPFLEINKPSQDAKEEAAKGKVPDNDSENSNTNSKTTTLLKETKTELKKVYSAADSAKIKEIVALIEKSVDKKLQDESYSYEKDASTVLEKYNKLSSSEKSKLKSLILANMKFDTMLNLKDVFLGN